MSSSTLADFELLQQLGKGTYGTVFKVRRKVDDRLYVLKQVSLTSLSQREQQDCINEVRLLASIESEYVVRYYDSFIDDSRLCIIMELCEQGDLHQLLKRQKSLLPEDTIWSFWIQLLLGLYDLHAAKILHRDVKSLNLFLSSSSTTTSSTPSSTSTSTTTTPSPFPRLKIGDLGVAKLLNSSESMAHTTVGTPYNLSPELCEGRPYNEKSDVWSAAIVLYELCTLRHPFDASNQGALILKILRGKYPPLPHTYATSKLTRVLDACLRKDTSLRPNVLQILASHAVYTKAHSLGFTLPKQVEEMVQTRKLENGRRNVQTNSTTNANVGGGGGGAGAAGNGENGTNAIRKSRTQSVDPSLMPTNHTFGLAPSIVPPSSSPSAASSSSTHDTGMVGVGRHGRRTAVGRIVGTQPSTQIIHGVAPARTKKKVITTTTTTTKTSSSSSSSVTAAAKDVRNLPDVMIPHHRKFVPSVVTFENDAEQQQQQHQQPTPLANLSSPNDPSSILSSFASMDVSTKVPTSSNSKPSVSIFKQAFGSPIIASPPSATTTNIATSDFMPGASIIRDSFESNMYSASECATERTQCDEQDDHDYQLEVDHESNDDDDHNGDEDDEYIDDAADDDVGDDGAADGDSVTDVTVDDDDLFSSVPIASDFLETDLIDSSSHDIDGILSGSAEEVQWRIVEEERSKAFREEEEVEDMNQHGNDEKEDRLYDHDDDNNDNEYSIETDFSGPSHSHSSQLTPRLTSSSSNSLDVSFGVSTDRPNTMSNHPPPVPSHPPRSSAQEVFAAVGARSSALHQHICDLRRDIKLLLGSSSNENAFNIVWKHFQTQSLSNEPIQPSKEVTTILTNLATTMTNNTNDVNRSDMAITNGSTSDSSSSSSSSVRMNDVVTLIYQLLYLEEEERKCQEILQLATHRHQLKTPITTSNSNNADGTATNRAATSRSSKSARTSASSASVDRANRSATRPPTAAAAAGGVGVGRQRVIRSKAATSRNGANTAMSANATNAAATTTATHHTRRPTAPSTTITPTAASTAGTTATATRTKRK